MMPRPRFTLGSLMLVTLVCAFAALSGRYLLEAHQADPAAGRGKLVIFVLVVPMLLLLIVQVAWRLNRWLGRR
jgi:hypothetical protein